MTQTIQATVSMGGLNLVTKQRTFDFKSAHGLATVTCRLVRYPNGQAVKSWFVRMFKHRENFGPWTKNQTRGFLMG